MTRAGFTGAASRSEQPSRRSVSCAPLEIARADDPTDTGPVGSDPQVDSLLDGALGDSIVADTSAFDAADGRTYWIKNHVDTSLLPTDSVC